MHPVDEGSFDHSWNMRSRWIIIYFKKKSKNFLWILQHQFIFFSPMDPRTLPCNFMLLGCRGSRAPTNIFKCVVTGSDKIWTSCEQSPCSAELLWFSLEKKIRLQLDLQEHHARWISWVLDTWPKLQECMQSIKLDRTTSNYMFFMHFR